MLQLGEGGARIGAVQVLLESGGRPFLVIRGKLPKRGWCPERIGPDVAEQMNKLIKLTWNHSWQTLQSSSCRRLYIQPGRSHPTFSPQL